MGLVRLGLLDGAIASSFSLARPLPACEQPACKWVAVMPLGTIGLQLVAHDPHTQQVLLHRRTALPLLHKLMEAHGFGVEQQPGAAGRAAAPERAALVAPAATR